MPKSKPHVIITRRLPEATEARMMELFESKLNLDDHPMSAQELEQAAASCDILVPSIADTIDHRVLAAGQGRLRMVASFGVGTDHIDLATAEKASVLVSNTPGVLTQDTADMTLALLLAVVRRLPEGERLVHSGRWQGWSPTGMLGHRLTHKRLGIIGMGRIGQAVAYRARAFGLSIHYHNRRRLHAQIEQPLEATYWENLDAMLSRIDLLSLHCPKTPATYHLLSSRRLKLIPPHVYVINTSRGEVVDEQALVRALKAGRLAGAALDVYERAPETHAQLLAADNVVMIPHMASATIEGRRAMGERVILNIQSFWDGHRPPDRVLPPSAEARL